jgi:hypothetical protein
LGISAARCQFVDCAIFSTLHPWARCQIPDSPDASGDQWRSKQHEAAKAHAESCRESFRLTEQQQGVQSTDHGHSAIYSILLLPEPLKHQNLQSIHTAHSRRLTPTLSEPNRFTISLSRNLKPCRFKSARGAFPAEHPADHQPMLSGLSCRTR